MYPSSPWPRSGLSLTEVLIAMGIMSIGLLSVASIFPVGSFYMQKAEISDRGSAIAQSVMNDLMARGMLNPRAWFVMVPNQTSTTPAVWNTVFPSDGKYTSVPTPTAGTFTRPLALALGEALNQPTATTDRTLLAKQFGNAFVIDPLGLSVLAFGDKDLSKQPTTQPAAFGPAAVFPASGYQVFYRYGSYPTWASSQWAPWTGGSNTAGGGFRWPIRRVTFRQSNSGVHLDGPMAEHYFRANDDLSVDFPARDDRPAMQKMDYLNGGQTPLARQWAGDYSWIVTILPTTNAARDAIAINPEGFAYDVSVVVFYKRPLPDLADNAYQPLVGTSGGNNAYDSAMGANERVVTANVLSTGLNGGELLLTDWKDYVDTSNANKSNAFEGLKTGQYIMLCGPHPNSSASEPRLALNWYQVLTIEPADSSLSGYNASYEQRVVTLRGPQWPWQPGVTGSDNLCVGICKGTVAVHTKTMRLEGTGFAGGGGGGGFGTSGNPTQTQPMWTPF